MNKVFPILILLFLTISTYPQTGESKEIKSIRDQYASVKAEIKKLESSEEAGVQSRFAVNELVVNKNNKSWPAVGNYSVVYRFYYKQFGEQPYPDSLVFVTKKTQSAARESYEEFLFAEDGSLNFSFQKDDDESEYRLYFDGSKLIDFKGRGDKSARALRQARTVAKSENLVRLFVISIQ